MSILQYIPYVFLANQMLAEASELDGIDVSGKVVFAPRGGQVNFATKANNTVAIIVNGELSKQLAEKYDVDARESAAILDIFSCIAQGAIPYGAQMLILLGFAKHMVSPTDLIPLLWYQMLLMAP